MFENICEDLDRYFVLSNPRTWYEKLKIVILTQGIWATVIYRMGAWCIKSGTVGRILLPLLTVCQKMIEITTGISIPFSAKIGKGLYIGHFGNIIINHNAVIGEYCNLSQGITIGQAGRGGKQLTPVTGNKVYLAPGAKIFGGIRIGNNVAIGANAVVVEDVPDNAVVGGIPARILNYKGSDDFIVVREARRK